MSPRRAVSGATLLACLAIAHGASSDWAVSVWQSDDGLPNNHVTGLAQTPDGYLWVATYSRPARFDGVRFDEFPTAEFAGVNDKIAALSLSPRGGLWMAFLHSTVVYLDARAAHVFTNGLPNRVPQTVVEDMEGGAWITYKGGFVYRLKDGVATPFTTPDGWPAIRSGDVSSLARDIDGRIWFAKSRKLGVFRDGRFETLQELPEIVSRIAAARSGGVWICSGGKLLQCDAAGQTVRELGSFPLSGPDDEPSVLLEDRKGGVWIGTLNSGLFRFDGRHFHKIPTSELTISSLLEDHEGSIWAGTGSCGLNRLRPRIVHWETAATGLPFETPQSLCEDADGVVWAASQSGQLARRYSNGWELLSTDVHWPGGRASCVAADAAGGVWIGTRDRALHRWSHGRYSTWRRGDGLVGREIHTLLVSRAGDLWIGCESPDRVQRFRNGTFETFPMPPNIRVIRAMTEDAAGNIWIGTSKGMLLRITPEGSVTDHTETTTGAPLSIRCLQATPDGAIWIGYADDGVGWLKNGTFAKVNSRKGLLNDTISQIVPDNAGWLWFGSDHGIFKARQTELEAAGKGRIARVHCTRYGKSEGLVSLEATTGDSPGALRTRDNRLWLPMRTGLAIVEPESSHQRCTPANVLLRQVTIDDELVASYGGVMPVRPLINLADSRAAIQFHPGHRRLAFEFTAPTFTAPENIRFRYQLEGFDERWVEATKERVATYPRLPAGEYRFHLKVSNSDGAWDDRMTSFAFTVVPFFWQTWWFKLAMFAMLLSGIVGFVRYVSFRRLRFELQRLEQQAALERERSRIARDIHDDLGSRLTEVELLINLAQRDPHSRQESHLQRISSTVRKVGDSLSEIVWAINPRHDTLPHMINYLGQYAIQFLQNAGIRCLVDFPEQPPHEPVLPEVRHNVFLVVKEALNNVARHANATEVWLRISLEKQSLRIAIEDNGEGIGGTRPEIGADGLENMRHRMAEMGGTFRAVNGRTSGTRIELMVPWPPHVKPSHAQNGNHSPTPP